ncbi:MAG: MFS transporter [Pseudomonadota bacterium]
MKKPFYGWAIAAMGMLGNAIQGGIIFWSMGMYTSAFEDEFGATRARITLIETLITAGSNLMSPLVGMWVDKGSARHLVAVGTLAMGAGLILISQAGTLVQVWVVYATLIPLGVLAVGMLPSSALIARWFRANRGLALGVSLTGSSIGGFLVPPVLAFMFVAYGWRTSLLVIGIGVMALAPVFFKVLANFPEDRGLAPEPEAPTQTPAASSDEGRDWPFRRLFRTPSLYLQTVFSGALLGVTLGLLANLSLHTKDLGFSTQQTAFLYSIIAFCSLAGKVVSGRMIDRFGIHPVAVVSMALMASGLVTFYLSGSYPALIAGCFFIGGATGGITPVWTSMISRRFGPRSFGRALGIQSPMHIPITAPTAPLAGHISDVTGSYSLVFLLYLGLVSLAAVALLLMTRRAGRSPAAG